MCYKFKVSFILIILLVCFSNVQAGTKLNRAIKKTDKRVAELENKVTELNVTINQMQSQLAHYSAVLEDVVETVSANKTDIDQNKSALLEIWNMQAIEDSNNIKKEMEFMEFENRFNKLQYKINTSEGLADPCAQTISFGETINDSWENQCYSTEWHTSKAKFYTFEINEARTVNIELSNEQKESFGMNLIEGNLRYGEKITSANRNDGFCSITMDLEPGFYTVEVYSSVNYNLKDFTLVLL